MGAQLTIEMKQWAQFSNRKYRRTSLTGNMKQWSHPGGDRVGTTIRNSDERKGWAQTSGETIDRKRWAQQETVGASLKRELWMSRNLELGI